MRLGRICSSAPRAGAVAGADKRVTFGISRMRLHLPFAALASALIAALFALPIDAVETDPFWRIICSTPGLHGVTLVAASEVTATAVASCGAEPTVFHELPSVGGEGDAAVTLNVGFDAHTSRLCYVNRQLSEAPVIRVGAGHRMTITLKNSLRNTGGQHERNCDIQLFGGSEGPCLPKPQFAEAPGPNGPYYPLDANQAHLADGTTNLHVHGLLVSPLPCSDEV